MKTNSFQDICVTVNLVVFLTNEIVKIYNYKLKNTHFSITWQPFPFYNVLQIIRYCVLIICEDKYAFLF